MKPVIIIAIAFVLLIPFSAFGESDSLQIGTGEHRPGTGSLGTIYHDMSKLDFEILDVQKFFIPKWINEPGDFSDIIQVKFSATNIGLEHFVVYQDMFQIDVIDPREQYREMRTSSQDYMVDNYYPQHIDDFEIRFQDIILPQSLFECEFLNHGLKINQTRVLSVCFDVKQKWSNQPLDFNGPRLYYLVMMDNKFVTSCPNCKSALLNEYYKISTTELDLAQKIPTLKEKIPNWVENIFVWHDQDQIGVDELRNAIIYLIDEGILVVK